MRSQGFGARAVCLTLRSQGLGAHGVFPSTLSANVPLGTQTLRSQGLGVRGVCLSALSANIAPGDSIPATQTLRPHRQKVGPSGSFCNVHSSTCAPLSHDFHKHTSKYEALLHTLKGVIANMCIPLTPFVLGRLKKRDPFIVFATRVFFLLNLRPSRTVSK